MPRARTSPEHRPPMGAALASILCADGPDTPWDADMLMFVGEAIREYEDADDVDGPNAPVHAVARELFPPSEEWDTGDLGALATKLAGLGYAQRGD